MKFYILDTSVLIALFSKKSFYKIHQFLEKFRKPRAAFATCGIILTEFYSGIDEIRRREYIQYLSTLKFLDSNREIYENAGFSFYSLRKQRIGISIADAVIAENAKFYGATLITLDKDFQYFLNLKKKIITL